jgi:hypothetical protein
MSDDDLRISEIFRIMIVRKCDIEFISLHEFLMKLFTQLFFCRVPAKLSRCFHLSVPGLVGMFVTEVIEFPAYNVK